MTKPSVHTRFARDYPTGARAIAVRNGREYSGVIVGHMFAGVTASHNGVKIRYRVHGREYVSTFTPGHDMVLVNN